MRASKEKIDDKQEYIIHANEREVLFLHYAAQHIPCNICAEALQIDQRECKDPICDLIAEKMWDILKK